MSKQIFITESQARYIKEYMSKEVTFGKFLTEVGQYLHGLLSNPQGTHIGSFFTENGITEANLNQKLLDLDIIAKKEGFDEPYNANGKKTSVHNTQYFVHKKNYDGNMHKLYDAFFSNGSRKINEEGECSCGCCGGGDVSGGANNAAGVGGQYYAVAFGGVQNRGNVYQPKKNKKKNCGVTTQVSNIDLSPTLARKNGKGGSISVSTRK